jgi:Family of unknown function (DUF6535)
MSLSCALWATLLHQWARRYIRLTQPARCSPEKRARMHAFFAEGIEKMHVPWAVEGLPTLLHLSLFLFFGGLVIFLFNVDQEVFLCVVWWIGLFTLVYGSITLLPLIRYNSPYYSPLSLPAWSLYASILYVTFKILAFFSICSYETGKRYRDTRNHYRGRMLGSVEKAAEEVVSNRSSEIDVRILGWTISALGDDDSLEKFFEAIPGFFNSKLVKHLEIRIPETLFITFWRALDGFMGRTSSSNLVTESVKSRRVLICRDIISMIPHPSKFVFTFNLNSYLDKAPLSIEGLEAMARWSPHLSDNVSNAARFKVGVNLPKVQKRDGRWIALASNVYGVAACDIKRNVAMGGDDTLPATLIDASRRLSRQAYQEGMFGFVKALSQIDIRHTLLGLQHDFCTLWNDLVQEAIQARDQKDHDNQSLGILNVILHLYITLHQGTDAAPTAFTASNDIWDSIRWEPSSYPSCVIASHRPASDPTTRSGIGDRYQVPATTSPAKPVHTSPRPTDLSQPLAGAVATTLQDIPPAATLYRSLKGTAQQDIVASHAEPDISEIMSTVSTPTPTSTLAPVPASIQHILNTPLTSCDVGAVSTADSLPPASSVVGSSIPTSPPPSRVPPLLKTPSHPTSNTTPPRLRARGLVNSGNMCFANAVLHLLVHSPPSWNLFKLLGDLKGQHGAGGPATGGGATPLVDATVRFFEEFLFKEEPPTTQQPLQFTARGKQREGEEEKTKGNKVVDSFEPTYMYDAMKEKRRLKSLLVRSHAQDALLCYRC